MPSPVYPILAADSGVSALVATRIYPAAIIPQEVVLFPCITYQTIWGSPTNVLSGSAPVDEERVQIDCWAYSMVAADQLGAAVRAAFENIPACAANGCAVNCTSINGDDYEDQTKRYRSSFDFSFVLLR